MSEAVAPKKKSSGPRFSRGQVAMHRTLNDCWIILAGKVYNVTPFMLQHPGGSAKLLAAAGNGKDAQELFEAEGHSRNAVNMLA